MASIEQRRALADAFAALRPREVTRCLVWSAAHVKDQTGRAFDHGLYPWIGAPGGPMDAFDDFRVREIWLQWASRLGKTFFGQCALLKTAAEDPAPAMFASSTEQLATDVIARTYGMIRHCRPLAGQVGKKTRRDKIRLRDCECAVAWSRSPNTLADKQVKFGHGNEVDKWEAYSTTKEGDPLKLFTDRGKDLQAVRKFIFESTPAVRGRSRVERGRLSGTDCRYWVPCPHCRRYQVLEFGGRGTDYGIKWARKEDGKSDPEYARAHAWYECRHCHGRIEDHHRVAMMRAGVWVPAGCTVDDKRARKASENYHAAAIGDDGAALLDWNGWPHADWVAGTPERDGIRASYQLSSLYALSLGWGDIAAEWLDSYGDAQKRRNFVNSWLGQTWEIQKRKQTWEQLAERITVAVPRTVIPTGYSLLTCGVDVQLEHALYDVLAWRPDRGNHLVDSGRLDDVADLQELLKREWTHADGGVGVRIALTLIDSGFRATEVGDLVRALRRQGINALICKGSSGPALGTYFRDKRLGKDTANPGERQILVDTISTQDWLDLRLHTLLPGDPGALTIFDPGPGQSHQDLLQQWLNETLPEGEDAWVVVDDHIPVDHRDATRYASVAQVVHQRGAPIPVRRATARPAPVEAPPGFVRQPQGRFLSGRGPRSQRRSARE